jgi:glycosyltransferase involved in cell wall biosynthesis
MMVALLWMPGTAWVQGGHQVQLQKTAEALRAAGVQVIVSLEPWPTLEGIDVVHGFELNDQQVHWCRARGVPVAISTIYWDLGYSVDGPPSVPSARAWAGRATRAGRLAYASLRGTSAVVRACLVEASSQTGLIAAYSAADLLLPNSRGEADAIRNDLAITTPVRIVPNAVDAQDFSLGTGDYLQRTDVLYVGRIEPHKNQLGLIEALSGTGRPLVIAGAPHPHHAAYLEKCRAAADASVRFAGSKTHSELAHLYRTARVHVLPSWFETTGLVSLEAALSGCNIVTTSRGHASEYFGDLARYCDPADPSSIRGAVEAAWVSPPSPELRQRVLERYTWAHTARTTILAYGDLLARRHRPLDA